MTPGVGGDGWVQADGALGASAAWRTAADWVMTTVGGLAEQTQYTFTVTARNGADVETAPGPAASATTAVGDGPAAQAQGFWQLLK